MNQLNQLNQNDTGAVAAAILTSMQEAVIYADLNGTIQLWNRGAEAIFGFRSEEALGQSVDIIIPEKLRAAHWAGFNKAVAHGNILSAPGARMTRGLKKDGDQLYVEMSFAMVRNEGGEMIGSIAVARDATARYLAERAARQQAAAASAKAAT
jgi:PAS domain S-box-containing protein